MDKVRFGIIGLGNQGSYYALNLFKKGLIVDGVITAMCDVNPSKIERMQKEFPENVTFFDDYVKMIKSGLVDAVLVETPHYSHPEIVTTCLEHNVHVICDKPAGVYAKQVREMNEKAKKSNAIFTMMFNQRTYCLYRKMHQMIRDGELGTLQRVTWKITNWYRTEQYYNSGSWRATWSGEGGGVLINQCPHQLDLLQWIVGELPVRVNGFCKYGKWHDIEVEDEVTAYFEYKNGATGVFITTTGEAPGTNRFEISGSLGKLVCEKGKLLFYKNNADAIAHSKTCPSGFSSPDFEIIEVETDGLNTEHMGIINNFVATLLGKEELFVKGEEGIRGVELMNAIEFSGWKDGATVVVPVNEDEYLKILNEKQKNSVLKCVDDNAVADTNNTF